MKISDRIKEVRKANGLTQAEFGEKLGMTRSMVVNLEMDKLKKDSLIKSSCRSIASIFNINEHWLLTGEGEMHGEISRKDEIAQVTARLYGADPESYPYKIAMKLASLNEEQWEMIRQVIEILSDK